MQIEKEFCQVLVKGISFELFFFSISNNVKIKNLPKTTRYDLIYNSQRDSYVLKKNNTGFHLSCSFHLFS